MDMETRIAKLETKIETIEAERTLERRERHDVLERIFSKLNDLHTRIMVQQEYAAEVRDLQKRFDELKTDFSSDKASTQSSLKTLGIVGSIFLAVGAGIGWLINLVVSEFHAK